MRESFLLSFGVFLLALGLGWYIFATFAVSVDIFGWILIITGAGIILSTLISLKRPTLPIRGLVGSLVGGLILSLFLTSGFGFITGWVGPYRAVDNKVYNGLVTVNNVYVEVNNFNGPIQVSTWDKTEYRISLNIMAKGFSQQNAEDNLNDLKIDFNNQIVQGQQRLTLKYDVLALTHSRYAIEVDVVLPADRLIDLDLDSSNGDIYLTDIAGNIIKMGTSNAQLVFNKVSADHIVGVTSNGGIEGTVEAPDTVLSTSNGRISLILPCSVNGQYYLSTSNGNIKLKISSSSQVGYDLDLSTSNGDIDIALSNLDYTQNQKTKKKAQSEDFSNKPIQIIIKASTSNSNIDVETS